MKNIIYILGITAISLSSCKKWLDVNTNPNSPNSDAPSAEQRLPPIITQFADGYESSGTRAAFIAQQLTSTTGSANNYNLSRWVSNSSSANWPWQCWYVNTAVNIQPLIDAATRVEAWHYVGAGKIMKAWGFGTLADFYGMLPYEEFDNAAVLTPKFDDGSLVQTKILALLDEGIADLKKTQGSNAPALSKGDVLNKGNVDNWIRLGYGLKARFLSHTNKKAGFNPQTVLDALANAPQTDAQSSIMQYEDQTPVTSAAREALQYTNVAATARVTKLYMDYILNNYTGAPTGANNMVDPRIDSLVPSAYDATGAKYRTVGVDMTSEVPKSGPSSYSFDSKNGYYTDKNPDSIYIFLRPTPHPSVPGRIQSTGTFYTRRGSKGLLLTNAEMRFLEAEAHFRLNHRGEAHTAYKAGIRSHMSIMKIPPAAIDQFLASTSVIQDPSQLTLSHIMIQKFIAMSYSVENWVDLRRLNFCADAGGNYNEATGVYKGWKRPSHVLPESYPNATDWPRRFAVASYEINFNIQKVLEANPNAAKPTYLNEPIWWDKP